MESLRPPKQLLLSDNPENDWKLWVQQFKFYATATGLSKKDNNIQAATFMTCIGPVAIPIFQTFKLNQDKMTLDELITMFEGYFTPKSNVTYERYVFNKMTQSLSESFDDFLTRSKTQIAKCKFEQLEDELLKGKIVIGVNSENLREKLLTHSDLTLNKAVTLGKGYELATKQMKMFKTETEVNLIDRSIDRPGSGRRNHHVPTIEYDCNRCNQRHAPRNCPAFRKNCAVCKKMGHFAVKCPNKKYNGNQKVANNKQVNEIEQGDSSDLDQEGFTQSFLVECVLEVNSVGQDLWFQELVINSKVIRFKLDTGAQCNVISSKLAAHLGGVIEKSDTRSLVSFSGHKLDVLGQTELECFCGNNKYTLSFKIINMDTVPILGIKACVKLNLVARVEVNTVERVEKTVNTDDIFTGLGCIKDFIYDIDIVPNAKFEIIPPRKIPYALRDQVKAELDNMVKLGVIKPIKEPSIAVSPIVIVRKNQKLRLCMDPSQVNKNILRRHYPLKTIEEISSRICGSKYFTKLDSVKGFWQVPVSTRTQKYLAFATPWGRYTCLRLPFGLASAPEVFQQLMSQTLDGILNVECSMDDILVHARTLDELRLVTSKVISALKTKGIKLNKSKCEFESSSVSFLGHIVAADGLKPDPEKLKSIEKLEKPNNVKQVQRLLGMVTYVSKFISGFSEMTAPLRQLLQKNVAFYWDLPQEQAFIEIKKALVSPPVLKFFDVNKDVKLSVDASSKALGAVLLQDDRPVAYASRSLTKCEQRYPQIEKEALAIKFALKKFHEYVYGKKLIVETDHKPLETIFKKALHTAPARLQRILFDVLPYTFRLTYRKGIDIPIADCLSRDCVNEVLQDNNEELELCMVVPMTQDAKTALLDETEKDKYFNILKKYILEGFPSDTTKIPAELKHFVNFREELSIVDNIIFKGDKIVIPRAMIPRILKSTHLGHLGIQTTLRRTKQLCYWKGLYQDVANYIETCGVCQQTQRSNIKEPIILKEVPILPFQIVASDLFNFDAETYVVIVDSYSGFMDFEKLQDLSSQSVIKFLKKVFSVHGTPQIFESDNGPQYASHEFKEFSDQWNFLHRTSSPHFARSNGLAERAVQTMKLLLKRCEKDRTDVYLALQNYRNSPRNDTLESPNQRLMNRLTRTNIPTGNRLLEPRIIKHVTENLQNARNKQKMYADRGAKESKPFETNDRIRIQVAPREWIGGKVVKNLDQPRSVLVKTDDERLFRRNSHHLGVNRAQINVKREPCIQFPSSHLDSANQAQPDSGNNFNSVPSNDMSVLRSPLSSVHPASNFITTRSGRIVKPVQKLDL